jgi:hypothetical protein
MEIRYGSEVGLKFAAMSKTICDVLASIAMDLLIFRKILAEKIVADAEHETMLEAFEGRLGKAYRSDIVPERLTAIDKALNPLCIELGVENNRNAGPVIAAFANHTLTCKARAARQAPLCFAPLIEAEGSGRGCDGNR